MCEDAERDDVEIGAAAGSDVQSDDRWCCFSSDFFTPDVHCTYKVDLYLVYTLNDVCSTL